MNIGSNLLKSFVKDINLNHLKNKLHGKYAEAKINNPNLQKNILNFYDKNTISPYLPFAAKGPWILTNESTIIYVAGGYGMLGYGHNPQWLLDTMHREHVMANVMTPSVEGYKMAEKLKSVIGHKICPYEKFAFLNSGSEAMELAGRIIDTNANKNKGKRSKYIVLKNGFHGRTSNAALFSNSCKKSYDMKLKSFSYHNMTETIDINDIALFNSKITNLIDNQYIIDDNWN